MGLSPSTLRGSSTATLRLIIIHIQTLDKYQDYCYHIFYYFIISKYLNITISVVDIFYSII